MSETEAPRNIVAGMRKDEVSAAVEAATEAELRELRDHLVAYGYSVEGTTVLRVDARLAEFVAPQEG